jgi:hypothetical protein
MVKGDCIMKRTTKITLVGLVITMLVFPILAISGVSTAAAATTTPPTATFTLISGLPAVMHVGDTATVIVQVHSDQPFNSAVALPDDQYPGRGVVAHGTDRSGAGTTATLSITFTAKSSTAGFADPNFPAGLDPVSVVAAARYGNAGTVSQRFDFNVQVP